MSIINYNSDFFSGTDVGLVRKANEDSCGTAQTPNGYLFVVCDGMGGHVGGATASNIAVQSIIEFFNSGVYPDLYLALNDALIFANEKIWKTALKQPELKGMGTTACILLVKNEEIWFAHVGDSRIYIFSDRQLYRITKDHSYVQGLVDQGMITDAEAEEHPNKNRILKALGIRENVKPTVCSQPILPKNKDIFMLCSDGLNGMVNDLTMRGVLDKDTSLIERGYELIQLAKQAGGTDNITTQLVEITNSPHSNSTFESFSPKENIITEEELGSKDVISSDSSSKKLLFKRILIAAVIIFLIGLGIMWTFSKGNSEDIKDEKEIIEESQIKETEQNTPPAPAIKINLSKYTLVIHQVFPEVNDKEIYKDSCDNMNSLNVLVEAWKKKQNSSKTNYKVYKYKPNDTKHFATEDIQYLFWANINNKETSFQKDKPEIPDEDDHFPEVYTYSIYEIDVWGNVKPKTTETRNFDHYYKLSKNGEEQEISSGTKQSHYKTKDNCFKSAKVFFNSKNDNSANYKCVVYNSKNIEVGEPFIYRHIKWMVKEDDQVVLGMFGNIPTLEGLNKDYKVQQKADNTGKTVSLQFYEVSVDWEYTKSGKPILVEPKPQIDSKESASDATKESLNKKSEKKMNLPQIPYYYIGNPINAGGTAEVFEGIDRRSGYRVAIKALFPSRAKDAFIMKKFREEANHYLYLQHPNITKLVDFVEKDGKFFIVMEFVDGIPLDEYLRTVTGPLADERLIPLFSQVLETIDFLHQNDLLHLDIKPGNIMVVDHSKIKILDMGISAKLSDKNNNMRKCGSPAFMSPEQINGETLGRYTDVFALGVTLFKMATGDLPFSGKQHTDIFNQILNQPTPPAAKFYPGINLKLQPVLEKSMHKQICNRYQNCEEFLTDIKQILV